MSCWAWTGTTPRSACVSRATSSSAAPATCRRFQARVAVQRACGVGTELLTPADTAARHPWLRVDDLGVASYGPDAEGWFDGPALLQAFKRKARAQGVEYIAGTVTGFEMAARPSRRRAAGSGARLAAGTVVNAAGPWSGAVGRMAGLDVPVVPLQAAASSCFDSPERMPARPVHLRHLRLHLPAGGPPLPVRHGAGDRERAGRFRDGRGPRLVRRATSGPRSPTASRGSSGCGCCGPGPGYTSTTCSTTAPSWAATPDVPNLVLACGFSGHGMMHSPAAGAGISELIVHGTPRSVDLAPFAFERIAAGRPIPEHVY